MKLGRLRGAREAAARGRVCILALVATVGCSSRLGIDDIEFGTETATTTTTSGSGGHGGAGGATSTGAGGSTSTASGGGGSDMPCTSSQDCSDGNPCTDNSCTPGHCTQVNAPDGPSGNDSNDDCVDELCTSGVLSTIPDNTEIPDDNNDCTIDACVGGVAQHPGETNGTPCGTGLTCDGSGKCVGCSSPSTCPGSSTSCKTKTCTAGTCGFDYAPSGTSCGENGNCDGMGHCQGD